MSSYAITHYPNDTVDVALEGVTILGYESHSGEGGNDSVTIGMGKDAYDSMAAGMSTPRVMELKRSLDDALTEVQRLSDERDALKAKLDAAFERLGEENRLRLVAERERERERDEAQAAVPKVVTPTRPAESTPWLGLDALRYAAPLTVEPVDELRAVIVSQAREIARLKGESE